MSGEPASGNELPSPKRGAFPARRSDLEQATPFVPDAEPNVSDAGEDEDRSGATPAPPERPGGADPVDPTRRSHS